MGLPPGRRRESRQATAESLEGSLELVVGVLVVGSMAAVGAEEEGWAGIRPVVGEGGLGSRHRPSRSG